MAEGVILAEKDSRRREYLNWGLMMKMSQLSKWAMSIQNKKSVCKTLSPEREFCVKRTEIWPWRYKCWDSEDRVLQ